MSSTSSQRRIAMFGTSRHCGLETLLMLMRRVAESAAEPSIEVHVFVRNEAAFREALVTDEPELAAASTAGDAVQSAKTGVEYKPRKATATSTRLYIHTGDALDADSVQHFFTTIVERHGPLTDVVSSLGTVPVLSPWKPFAPFRLGPGLEFICRDTMRNITGALRTVVAPRQPDQKAPRLIVVSANGIGKSTLHALPAIVKPLYSWWLINARIDKEGMEKLLHELYGVRSPDFNPHSVGPLHPEFVRDRLTIVRPSMLTNGKAGGNMRTSTTTIPSAWTVSRKDVGAFLAGDCLGLAQARTGKPVPGGNGIVLSY